MKGKRGYIIGLSLIILVFGIWVIKEVKSRGEKGNLQKNVDKVSGLKEMPKNEKDNTNKKVGYVVLNDKKAKGADFKFVDQNKDTITEKDYEGKVYVVEFFYTSCPTICPIMNENLKEVAKEFKNNAKFGIASFSIDPKHDTPQVLKQYAEDHSITHPNWHLMTGQQNQIYDLAQNGFHQVVQEDINEPGGIMHDGFFVLIDKEGYIRSRKDEFGNPIIYYRGYIKRDADISSIEETPQINALIQDIKDLLHE